MYCNCTNPQKVKSEANGEQFTVCSKNLGGCGKEVILQYNFPKNYESVYRPPIWVDDQCYWRDYQGNNITCPNCYGGGIEMKLYPNGPTEIKCEICNGNGYEEIC